MSTVALVALVVAAFSAGALVGMLVTAACAAGAGDDAWRRGYLRGLHSHGEVPR